MVSVPGSTCAVLHCSNTADATVLGENPRSPVEVVVCAEHKRLIDGGARWDCNRGLVLIAGDLPPRVSSIGLSESVGSRGVYLELDTGSKSLKLFLTTEDIDQLVRLLGRFSQ